MKIIVTKSGATELFHALGEALDRIENDEEVICIDKVGEKLVCVTEDHAADTFLTVIKSGSR